MPGPSEISVSITKEANILPSPEEMKKDENEGEWLGCLGYLGIFGLTIYKIWSFIANRKIYGYGFLDIVKLTAIWIVGAFVACVVLVIILSAVSKVLGYRKKRRDWEEGKFRRYCTNTSIHALSGFNRGEIERKLNRIEDNLQLVRNRLREVQKMAREASGRS
jgi:hypothetical protein